MALDPAAAQAVLAQIDRDELAQLGADLTSIPSPTGQEKAIGEFILNWFEANGLRAVRQDVEFDRPNAVGIVKGDGTGLSLGFNGHTDTSFTGTEEDRRMVAVMEAAVRTRRQNRRQQSSRLGDLEHERRRRRLHDGRQGAP